MKLFEIILCGSLYFFLPLTVHAQDTASTQSEVQYNWAGGIIVGAMYPALSGSGRTIGGTTIGFTYGFEVEYKQIFLRLLRGSHGGSVRGQFESGNEWPTGLPLDITDYFSGLGYRFRVGRLIALKPMLTVSELDLSTEQKVKDFTGIDRSLTLRYYGIALTSNIHFLEERIAPRQDYEGTEFSIGVSWPLNPGRNPIFANALWNFTLICLIIPAD